MSFFLTLTWNFKTASNSERISEFEAFKKRAELKGTITEWVIEYQPTTGYAHVHCLYTTSHKTAQDIKWAYKRKGLHIHPIPVKKGTTEYLKGYIHKPATKEPPQGAPASADNVAQRMEAPIASDPAVEDEVPAWIPTPEWRQQQAAQVRFNPIPRALIEFY